MKFMKIERTKNAVRNILFGGILKGYQILMPFLMRTAMIYFLGVQYLGLSSLFTSVLQVLNLAELGVGNAMVYSMYKPIAEDNEKEICALMGLYRAYYGVIGFVIAVIGILLMPFLPKLIKSDVPADMNIYVLYLLNLAATVCSYWLFAYKNCLLNAHQRVDVISKVNLLTNTVRYAAQFFVLCFLHNYYMYFIAGILTQIMTNLVTAAAVTKFYPNYKPDGKLNQEKVNQINHRIRDLFTSKIGTIVINSVDTIVISAFLGLTVLAVYENYYFILNSIIGFVTIIFNACTAGIGNSVIVETKEKNYADLKKFTFIIAWISGFCTCCLLCLYQPFMKIWVGEELMLSFYAVICFCVYYFVFEINQLLNTYKDAAGLWHEDRFRPLITAMANLGMNLIMVQFWGIYGIMLSTVLATLFVGMPWLLHNLFTCLFDRGQQKNYVRRLVQYASVSAVACAATLGICSLICLGDWSVLAVRLLICMIVPNLLFFISYRGFPEFCQSMQLIHKIIPKKSTKSLQDRNQ